MILFRGVFLRLLMVFLFVLHGSLAMAADVVGGESLDLFAVGFAASEVSLGEAVSAKKDNSFGGFYNPATVPKRESAYLYSFQGKVADQVDLFALTTLFSLWDSPISLTWLQLQAGNIPLVASENVGGNTDIEPDSFANYEVNGVVAATAIPISSDWSVGVSVMGYTKRLSDVSGAHAYGYSVTPGIYGALDDSWTCGMYFRNLLSQEKWATAHSGVFIPEWHTGLSYQHGFLSVMGEWVLLPKSSYAGYGRLGLALNFGDVFFLRGGYQQTHMTAGFGIQLGSVSVDYAFVGSSARRFGESSRFSIGVAL